MSFQPSLTLMSVKETSLLGSSGFFSSLYRKLNYQPRTTSKCIYGRPLFAVLHFSSEEGVSTLLWIYCEPCLCSHVLSTFLDIFFFFNQLSQPSLSSLISPSLLIIPLWPTLSKKYIYISFSSSCFHSCLQQ